MEPSEIVEMNLYSKLQIRAGEQSITQSSSEPLAAALGAQLGFAPQRAND
jgi:hypothetical protein